MTGRSRRVAAILTVGLMLGFAAGACGGDDGDQGSAEGGSTSSQGSTSGADASEVTMSEYKFGPANVTAKQGTELAVKNAGAIQHDLKLRKAGEEVAGTELVDAGKSSKFKVDVEPGSYEMFCSVAWAASAGAAPE